MPSIKTCLTSLLAVTMALAPVASARNSLHDGSLLARGHSFTNTERALESPSNDLEKRGAAAKRVALRRAAAAKAYKKKSKSKGRSKKAPNAAAVKAAPVAAAPVVAAAAAAGPQEQSHRTKDLPQPAATPAAAAVQNKSPGRTKAAPGSTPAKGNSGGVFQSSYAPGSAFMTSALVAAFGNYRCTTDANCNSVPGRPANSYPFCLANPTSPFPLSQCTYRCNAGFVPMSDGTCQVEPTQCNGVGCPSVINGFNTCTAPPTNGCQPGCNEGDTLNGQGNQCFNLNQDVDNCGAIGNQCPESYTDAGSPTCNGGKCGIACPPLYVARRTTNPMEPLGCYRV